MKTEQQSNSTNQNSKSRDFGNPENISLRKAAARLKQKQSQVQMLKKRFRVLKGQQQYNRYRTLDQERRINHHNSLHQSIKQDRLSLQKQLGLLRDKQAQQLKSRHDKIQQQLKSNTKQIFDNLYTSRIQQRNKLKQQSSFNQKTIEQNKKQALEQNLKKKQMIKQDEKRSKIHYKQFKNNHMKQTINNRSMESSRITQLTEKKDKELQKLMMYEQEMLKRASESIAMNHKLKNEFDKVFVEVKEKNSIKFPSITRGSSSYRSNQTNLSRNLSIYQI